MSKYHRREITYDPATQNYTVSVPELNIEVYADTEASGLQMAREEVEQYAKKLSKVIKDNGHELDPWDFT